MFEFSILIYEWISMWVIQIYVPLYESSIASNIWHNTPKNLSLYIPKLQWIFLELNTRVH